MTNKQFYAACCGNEGGLFRKVFAAVPDSALDTRPEPKARSPRELMGHMIGHDQDCVELIEDGVIHHRNVVPFETVEEALAMYDEAHGALVDKLSGMGDEAWGAQAQMLVGDHVAWEGSAGEIMWGLLFDSIHHRGQLTTHLRPNGGKVPALYGPSADEPGHA